MVLNLNSLHSQNQLYNVHAVYLLPWNVIFTLCLPRDVIVIFILDDSQRVGRSDWVTSKSCCETGEILTVEVGYWEFIPTALTVVMEDCKKCLHGSLSCFQSLQEHCGSWKLTISFVPDDLVIWKVLCNASVSTTCACRNLCLFILDKQWSITFRGLPWR